MLLQVNLHGKTVKKKFGLKGDSLWVDWYEPFFNFAKQNDVRAISHIFYTFEDSVILKRWREQLNEQDFILARSQPLDVLLEGN